MKTIVIAQMVLRVAFVLALILGIIFWINPAFPQQYQSIQLIHMLLGIILVISLWLIGLAQGFRRGGSIGFGIGTFIVGLAVAIVGMAQISWKDAGANVELINSIHLLLAVIAIGLGEATAARSKRLAKANASA